MAEPLDHRPDGLPVELAAPPQAASVDTDARTISGLVVPYGPAGQTAAGQLTFTGGALRWSAPSRVKLLIEHDQGQPVGYARSLEERPGGLWASFYVPEGDAGDRALREARDGLRDGLSVGSQLDNSVAARLRKAQASGGGAVAATGMLREVSLVSVPAFDDARVESVAATAALVVSAWADPDPEEPLQEKEDAPMTITDDAPLDVPAPAAPEPADAAVPVVRAAAGSALVTAAQPTYTFDGSGPSLMADAAAAQGGDGEAGARLARFNAELCGRNPRTQAALAGALGPLATAAVLTRGPVPDAFLPGQTRPALQSAIDAGRVLAPLTTQVGITNATPFQLPVIGRFTGVGDHTEGTPHVAEGVLELGDAVVTPRAVSGAYRVSRELVDSSNPVIDQLALGKMVDDYQRATEARIVAALAAAAPTATTGVGTVMALRLALLGAIQGNRRPAAVAVGQDYFGTLLQDADTTGRPFFSSGPAVNTAAALSAGFSNASVDGSPLLLSEDVPAGEGYAFSREAVVFAESTAQTFRLEQPEGPGIVKLAVWGYVAAAVVLPGAVTRVAG